MSVEAYMTARAALTDTNRQVKELANVLATVASSLQSSPTKFIFSNQPIGLPMEATMSRGASSVQAEQWPTVEGIMRLLERLHQQRGDLQSAWGALGRNEQESMKSPDDLLGQSGYGRY